MPVHYSSILVEHQAVREHAGLFDVSHMGEFIVTGSDAEDYLQWIVTGDIKRLEHGQCLFANVYENGTIVDDLLVYKHSSSHYMIVVNASNIDKDFNG